MTAPPRMTSPAVTAILDQAGAASAHAAGMLHAIAALDGSPITHARPGPVARRFLEDLRRRGISGQLDLCPHLSYTAPAVAFWLVWAPERLRCPACATEAAAQLRGTPEDRRCDGCRRLVEVIHNDAGQLPPVVVDLHPAPPKALPAITALFGLCPGCQRADQAGPPAMAAGGNRAQRRAQRRRRRRAQ